MFRNAKYISLSQRADLHHIVHVHTMLLSKFNTLFNDCCDKLYLLIFSYSYIYSYSSYLIILAAYLISLSFLLIFSYSYSYFYSSYLLILSAYLICLSYQLILSAYLIFSSYQLILSSYLLIFLSSYLLIFLSSYHISLYLIILSLQLRSFFL